MFQGPDAKVCIYAYVLFTALLTFFFVVIEARIQGSFP